MSNVTKTLHHYGWEFNNVTQKNFFTPESVFIDNDNKIINFTDVVSSSSDNTEKEKMLENFRRAAVIHKIVRSNGKKLLKEGAKYWDIVRSIEDDVLRFTKCDDRKNYFSNLSKYKNGIAFPVGFSVNEIAAHDTSYPDDDRLLDNGDIVKIDIGVMYDGYIIDSAFTHIIKKDDTADSPYDSLLQASADATYSAISISGVDARLYELSETIEEIISSYEVDLGHKTIQISPIRGLGGHNILHNKVHGDKLILCIPHKIQEDMKMEDGEVYAIETYASTGYGEITKKEEVNHISFNTSKVDKKTVKFMNRKNKSGLEDWLFARGDLPFTPHWCEDAGLKNSLFYIKKYVESGIVSIYPPLTDTIHSKTSQFEHTIYIKESGVEILSLGDDY